MAGSTNSIVARNVLRGRLSEDNLMAGAVGTAYNPTYAIVTEAGAQITLYINSSNYQFYAELKDKYGNHIANSNIIDLPLESMVVNGSYDAETKEVVLILDNGNEVRFSVADLVEGLVSTEQLNTILGDYVKFTDYATSSKGGVIITNTDYGTSMNNAGRLIGSIKNYTQYNEAVNYMLISKGTLENVITGKELTNKTYVDNADAVFEEDLFGNKIVNGSGENITLNNSANKAPMKIELKGNTYQYSTSGKNLLNCELETIKGMNTFFTWNGNVGTYAGITITINNDNTIKINGTNNQSSNIVISIASITNIADIVALSTPVKVSVGDISGSRTTYYVRVLNYSETASKDLYDSTDETITIENSTTRVYIVILPSTTLNNVLFKPMIRLASITDNTYEPYTNGASPNPDYPQPIQVVSGDNSIVVGNANIFEITDLLAKALNVVDNGNGSYTFSSSSNMFNFATPLKYVYDGQITISYKITNGTGTNFRIKMVYEDGFTRDVEGSGTGTSEISISYTNYESDYTSHGKVVSLRGDYSIAGTFTIRDFMVNCGITALPYESYKETSYPINLPVENLIDYTRVVPGGDTTITLIENGFNANGNYAGVINVENLKKNTDYFLSFDREIISGTTQTVVVYAGTTQTTTLKTTYGNDTFNTGDNTTINIWFYCGVSSSNRGEQNFTNIQLEVGTKANHYTPYGTTPIELCKIGDYQDYIRKSTGKNLFDKANSTLVSKTISNSTRWGYKLPTTTKNFYYSKNNDTMTGMYLYEDVSGTLTMISLINTTTQQVTNTGNDYYIFYMGSSVQQNAEEMFAKGDFMISYENIPYEPYGTNKWYLHKEIGKVVLNGSENWTLNTTGTNTYRFTIGETILDNAKDGYCNNNQWVATGFSNDSQLIGKLNNMIYYRINKSIIDSLDMGTAVAGLQKWLESNNSICYSILATPTNTEITDNTLINQLNDIENAYSYENQTNISQVNDDLPFIIAATAFVDSTAGKLAAASAQINTLNEVDNNLNNTKEDKSNKVVSISALSTDTQYPTAKCVYDIVGDVETLLTTLDIGNGVA